MTLYIDVFLLFHAFPLKKEHKFGMRNSDKYRIPTFMVQKTNISKQYSLEFRTICKFARPLVWSKTASMRAIMWMTIAERTGEVSKMVQANEGAVHANKVVRASGRARGPNLTSEL